MTTPTVPPTSEPVEVPPSSYYAIELDPLAPPAGTGLEGWGGQMAEAVTVCLNGQTVSAIYWGEYQAAVTANTVGACPEAAPTPTVAVAPQVAAPRSLPVTGTSELVQIGVAGSLLLIGASLLRLTRRTA